MPDGTELTDQGTGLSFGETGTVIFESAPGRGTVLQLNVKGVKQGSIADFKGFILDDAYKQKAAYYYATVQVKNVGEGDVGGVGVPLWGVNEANTLLPAVNFTTSFAQVPLQAAAREVRAGRDPGHLPGLPLAGQGRVEGRELPAHPGVRPDHLDRRDHQADPDAHEEGDAQEEEEGLTRGERAG